MDKKKKPEWWPENPYPKSVFPMEDAEYLKIVPNPKTRTALSGCPGRHFWEIASEDIFEAVGENIGKQRIIDTLEWLVKDARWRFDQCKDAMDDGSTGGYSDELTEAINLLKELKGPQNEPVTNNSNNDVSG